MLANICHWLCFLIFSLRTLILYLIRYFLSTLLLWKLLSSSFCWVKRNGEVYFLLLIVIHLFRWCVLDFAVPRWQRLKDSHLTLGHLSLCGIHMILLSITSTLLHKVTILKFDDWFGTLNIPICPKITTGTFF